MARTIVIHCDQCLKDGAGRVPGTVIDIAIRTTDPEAPPADLRKPILGTLEVCGEHASPVTDLAALLAYSGTALNDEAARLLAESLTQRPAGESATGDYVMCHTCVPPKKLRRGSLYGHTKGIHGPEATTTSLDIRPAGKS